MEFYKNGVPVELSKTEQRILYILAANPGQILSRERLLEWVWPEGTEYVEDNALSVGIRRLRDKLEEDSSNPVYQDGLRKRIYVGEIRTPLSNITLYTGLLKEHVTDEQSLMFAQKIEKNAGKLEFFMKELIKTSYTEQEIISVCPQPADVDTIIKKACQLAELSE